MKTGDLIVNRNNTTKADAAADAALTQAQQAKVKAAADRAKSDAALAHEVAVRGPITDPATLTVYQASADAPGYTVTPSRGLDADIPDDPAPAPAS